LSLRSRERHGCPRNKTDRLAAALDLSAYHLAAELRSACTRGDERAYIVSSIPGDWLLNFHFRLRRVNAIAVAIRLGQRTQRNEAVFRLRRLFLEHNFAV